MYHSVYPTSFLLGNHLQQKSSVFMNYSDVSVVAVDPATALACLGHIPKIYSPVILDLPNMKRVPIHLMHGIESMNYFIPTFQKDFSWTVGNRRYSKDGLVDSGSASDGCASTSRSSSPSSVENSCSVVSRLGEDRKDSYTTKHPRKFSDGNRFPSGRPKYPLSNQKSSSTDVQQKHHIPYEKWDEVSKEIWRHYMRNRQPEEMYFRKMRLRNIIQNVLNETFPNCGLWVVGSSVNGLGTDTSDMDMCLVLTSTEIDQQTEAMLLLRCVQSMLQSKCSFIKSTELINAKVPILKFTDKLNIQVDLNINNTVGIANTVLIRDYCCMDWRVQPLVLVIKKWAQDCNINNAKDMTLSSYSLTLMVVHYLQCGCHPNVLPCLQKMRPDSHKDLPKFKSSNTDTLGDLLFGFFNYFSNVFDFERDVMSIRLGCKISKYVAMNYRSAKNKRGHWKYICIEEPFNRTNTACAVYDADSFARILTAFRTTWMKLKITRNITAVLKL